MPLLDYFHSVQRLEVCYCTDQLRATLSVNVVLLHKNKIDGHLEGLDAWDLFGQIEVSKVKLVVLTSVTVSGKEWALPGETGI